MRSCVIKGRKTKCHVLIPSRPIGNEHLHFESDDDSFFIASVFLEDDNVTARLCGPDDCREIGFPFVISTRRGGKVDAEFQRQEILKDPYKRRQFGEAIAQEFRRMGYKIVYGGGREI